MKIHKLCDKRTTTPAKKNEKKNATKIIRGIQKRI